MALRLNIGVDPTAIDIIQNGHKLEYMPHFRQTH